MASELFFFHVELWEENPNPQHRHNPFAISKMKFSEKLYVTQKILHESFETYGPFVASKVSRILAFGIFTAISTAPKNKTNAARLIYIRTGCKIGILSENKLSQAYILIK